MSTYTMPSILDEIMKWENEVRENFSELEWPSGYLLRFDPSDNGGYPCSPADAIQFANTGMDGIHFAFLTDFGMVKDLNRAPIVVVDPMNFGNSVRIVANDIRGFFELRFSGHEGLLMNDFASREDYTAFLSEEGKDHSTPYFDHSNWKRQKEEASAMAMARFGLQSIEDGFAYVEQARLARRERCVLDSSGGIGVAIGLETGLLGEVVPHPWHEERIPEHNVDELLAYIDDAEQVGLFGFIRDCQAQGVTNAVVVRALCDRLESIGLSLEAKKLLHCLD